MGDLNIVLPVGAKQVLPQDAIDGLKNPAAANIGNQRLSQVILESVEDTRKGKANPEKILKYTTIATTLGKSGLKVKSCIDNALKIARHPHTAFSRAINQNNPIKGMSKVDLGVAAAGLGLGVVSLAVGIANTAIKIKDAAAAYKLHKNGKTAEAQPDPNANAKGKQVAGKNMGKRAAQGIAENSVGLTISCGLIVASIGGVIQQATPALSGVAGTLLTVGVAIAAPLWGLFSTYASGRNSQRIHKARNQLKAIHTQIEVLEKRPVLTFNDEKKLRFLRYAKRKIEEKKTNEAIDLVKNLLSFAGAWVSFSSVFTGPGFFALSIMGGILFGLSALGSLTAKLITYGIRRHRKQTLMKLDAEHPKKYIDTPTMVKEMKGEVEKDLEKEYDFDGKEINNPDDWTPGELAVFLMMGNKGFRAVKNSQNKRDYTPDDVKQGFVESPTHFWKKSF